MSKVNYNSRNDPPNVYLIFDEITIPEGHLLYNNIYSTSVMRRHADGSNNLNGTSFLDPDTATAPLIIPPMNINAAGAALDQNSIVQNIKKYFEIFNVNIQVRSDLPFYADMSNFRDQVVKILPPRLFTGTSDFNNLPAKYYPFKRVVWHHEKRDPDGQQEMYGAAWDPYNWSMLGFDAQNTANPIPYLPPAIVKFVPGIVHEIGHLFDLDHQSSVGNPSTPFEEYHGGAHEGWSPIMGYTYDKPLFQWSNTDYVNGVAQRNSYLGGRAKGYQNDFDYMNNRGLPLIKLPYSEFEATPPGPNFGSPSQGLSGPIDKEPEKDFLIARYATLDDLTTIIGMIGFDKNYDIIKVLVPRGFKKFTVEPYLEGGELVSMLNPKIEILSCNCDLEFDKSSRPVDDYTKPWKPNLPSNWSAKNIFHPVKIENKEEYISRSGTDKIVNNLPASELEINTSYTTLLYLKISGNSKGSINSKNKKPLEANKGYSSFGSVGKYILKMSGPSIIDTKNVSNLPIGRFEKFKVCKDGNIREEWLLVQNEDDNSLGDSSKEGMHVVELPIIKNGTKENKKFIVFRKPLSPSEEEKDGRYYLTINNEGEFCQRQEFILGICNESSGPGLNTNPNP
jgi:hypothetical protein